MRIYSQVRLGVTPEINAVSAILIGMVALILVGGYLVGWRKPRQA
jgi:putrescine transport system permease protein